MFNNNKQQTIKQWSASMGHSTHMLYITPVKTHRFGPTLKNLTVWFNGLVTKLFLQHIRKKLMKVASSSLTSHTHHAHSPPFRSTTLLTVDLG
ncbi:hypothetical protein VNO80_01302 [Phaseolus coccineus]|uniref:Uncharacterized protein n=1 Tax=Phaseolus coccineus TaxID=3886 RepID=A0AAN9RSM5_PHACN